jgi:hypothetical protein
MAAPTAIVTTHESGRGHWQNVRRQPDSRIRAHVGDYQGYEQVTPGTMRERHMPGGTITVIINLGPNLRTLDRRATPARSSSTSMTSTLRGAVRSAPGRR